MNNTDTPTPRTDALLESYTQKELIGHARYLERELAAANAKLAEATKMAPVQGYATGIPWSVHLRAYDVYCKKYGAQDALITGSCRGGFHAEELDKLIPGWRDEVSELTIAKAKVAALEKELAESKRAVSREIQNRDLREEIINQLCAAAGHRNGFEFEWTSHYWFSDAVNDVRDIFARQQKQLAATREHCRVLMGALQQIADESQKHHEFNPVSGKSLLPQGYTKIMNLASDALATTPEQIGAELAGLRAWKESAIQVEREWDDQELAKITKAPLGSRIRAHLMKAVPELVEFKRRLEWLHTGGGRDLDGFEWGVYRVKWDAQGQPVSVMATNSDFSDLDAEMEREESDRIMAEIDAMTPEQLEDHLRKNGFDIDALNDAAEKLKAKLAAHFAKEAAK